MKKSSTRKISSAKKVLAKKYNPQEEMMCRVRGNGVRLAEDHALYAEFLKAADTIHRMGKHLFATCIDLSPAIVEAELLYALGVCIDQVRNEIEFWRTGAVLKPVLEERQIQRLESMLGWAQKRYEAVTSSVHP